MSWSDSAKYYSGDFVDGWVTEGDLRLHANDTNWVNTGELAGAIVAHSLFETSQGELLAGTESNGNVFKSIDAGTTWVNTGELAAADAAFQIIQTSDGALYVGTALNGDVFKSTDAGTTWVNTGELVGIGINYVFSLLEDSDGALYAGTGPDNGHVFKSVDAGTTWTDMGNLVTSSSVMAIIETPDGDLFAATEGAGDVYRSVDAGTTWANTGELTGAWTVYSLIQALDGALYAGTHPNGDIFKSTDAGTTWVNTGELVGAGRVPSLLQIADGTLYAGADNGAGVTWIFRSVDAGTTWANIAQPLGAGDTRSLIQLSDGNMFAATAYNGDVFKTQYFTTGDLVSSVYTVEDSNVSYGIMTWDATLNDQTLYMRVRTDVFPDMFTAPDWDTCPPVSNGQDISALSSVDDNERYIQYRVEFSTSRTDVSPILHEVTVEYDVPGVEEEYHTRPQASDLWFLGNRPDPFHQSTTISFSLPQACRMTLSIFNITGRLVETLVNESQKAGIHKVCWDRGSNPSGVYFCRLTAGESVRTKKMVVVD
jgi:photosystem II stability/assembly factor-like uncharacterized protein